MLTQATFQDRTQAILARVARHKGTLASPCTEQGARTLRTLFFWMAVVVVALVIPAAAMGADMRFDPVAQDDAGRVVLVGFAVFFLEFLVLCTILSNLDAQALYGGEMDGIIGRLASIFGLSFPITPDQARKIVSMIGKHPSLDECATRWIAYNRSNKLTSREYLALKSAGAALEKLNKQWEEEKEARARAEKTDAILNELGLVDRGTSLAQAQEITRSTPQATSPKVSAARL